MPNKLVILKFWFEYDHPSKFLPKIYCINESTNNKKIINKNIFVKYIIFSFLYSNKTYVAKENKPNLTYGIDDLIEKNLYSENIEENKIKK